MSDDIEQRADDFERRVKEAGGTREIIHALKSGFERQQKIVRWLVISLCLHVVISLVLGIFGIMAFSNARTIKKESIISCLQTNKNSDAINGFLDLLITFTKQNTTLSAKEKELRVQGYESAKIVTPNCYTKVVER